MEKKEIINKFIFNLDKLMTISNIVNKLIINSIENYESNDIKENLDIFISKLEKIEKETRKIDSEINLLRIEAENYYNNNYIIQNENSRFNFLNRIYLKIKDIFLGFNYWYKHYKTYQKVAIKYRCWRVRFLLHDIEKPFLNIFMNREEVHKLHRKYSSHHVDSKGKKDYLGMMIDWECARYTKPSKPLNAKETCDKIYPETKDKIYPLLKKYNLL
jgi:hypothetical protein